ncbi:hypothetical protein C0995_005383 [Termitomyces sp. Mi166|nr:hypothetical protein C0995_005383 [Termitomyces sp. Mi166\
MAPQLWLHSYFLVARFPVLKHKYETEKQFHEALSFDSEFRRLYKEKWKESLNLLEKLKVMGLKEIQYKGLLASTAEEECKHLEKALSEAMEENGHLREMLKLAAKAFMKA